jgi:hypothetical protein
MADDGHASRPENPMDLGEQAFPVGNALDDVLADHGIEAGGRKRQWRRDIQIDQGQAAVRDRGGY